MKGSSTNKEALLDALGGASQLGINNEHTVLINAYVTTSSYSNPKVSLSESVKINQVQFPISAHELGIESPGNFLPGDSAISE
jgi:hypothetical protein